MKDAKLPESTDPESSSRVRLPFWLRDLLADIAGSPPDGFGARVLGGVGTRLPRGGQAPALWRRIPTRRLAGDFQSLTS